MGCEPFSSVITLTPDFHARYTLDWRGRRAAILAIVGFAALVFIDVGVDYLLAQIHGT